MIAKHTPGPWTIEPETGAIEAHGAVLGKIYRADDYPCAIVDPEDEIEDGEGSYQNIDDECKANAALAAAAPDLLDACEAFVEAWKKSLQLEKTDVALRMAEAAIEKAKGLTDDS